MGSIVLKRNLDTVPKPKDIMQILLGDMPVNEDKAAKALEAFMGPMTNLLKLFHLIESMEVTAERHTALLKEQEVLIKIVEAAKTEVASVKASSDEDIKLYKESLDKAVAQGEAQKDALVKDIANLTQTKAELSKEIETEQAAKLRLDSTVSAEYTRLRKEMLVAVEADRKEMLTKVEADRKEAQKSVDVLNAMLPELEAKRDELKKIREALDKLTSGGGGDVIKELMGTK